MKAVTIKILKDELKYKSQSELMELCLHLSRFKKENKELLTYLLFESQDEENYIEGIKEQMDVLFDEINTSSYFYIRKSFRKILALIKKYIRYSKKKETEAELLIYYCKRLKEYKPSIKRSSRLTNVYQTQLRMLKKVVEKLHEDLQYDYQNSIKELEDFLHG